MSNVCPTTGTYSEEYKRRCLVRCVCLIPTKEQRLAWLAGYAKQHGLAAMMKFRSEVAADFPRRREPLEVPDV